MSKVGKKVIILLFLLNSVLGSSIIFLNYCPLQESVYIPIRPQLTLDDPLEVLLIKSSSSQSKIFHGLEEYYSRQISEILYTLLTKEGQILNKEQISGILPYADKVYRNKKQIDCLNNKTEKIKVELELFCASLSGALTWEQLDFCISSVDLLTLKIYEFPYWQELLDKLCRNQKS